MMVSIESTMLSQKGFISLFKTHRLVLTVRLANDSDNYIARLSLKAKTAFIGYVFPVPTGATILYIEIADAKNADEEKILFELDVSVPEGFFGNDNTIDSYLTMNNISCKREVKVNTSKYKGAIVFEFVNQDMFTYLENVHLAKANKKMIDQISKSSGKSVQHYNERISYEGRFYYANRECTLWNLQNTVSNDELLPNGWEKRYTEISRKTYYVNHNKNLTQWENTNGRPYIIELENKILQYKLLNESSNLLNFFDFTKFKIQADRKFLVQSTAVLFLFSSKPEMLKTPTVIFSGEMGEDYGALVKEFFYEGSLEIAGDERIKCVSGVFDVKSMEEREKDNELKEEFEMHKRGSPLNKPVQSPIGSINEPNLIDTLLTGGTHRRTDTVYVEILPPEQHGQENGENSSFYAPENEGKNRLCDKDFYTYLGVFLGLAFEHEINIAINFSMVFFENLLNRNFDLSLIQDVQMQSGMQYILKNKLEEGILFDEKGDTVTEETKHEYVDKILKSYVYESKKQEYDWIRAGFYRIALADTGEIFSTLDLMYFMSGKEEITFEMIQNSVLYFNCTKEDKEIQWLWKILETKEEPFLRRFLQFLSGSASVPVGGLKSSKFKWFIEIVNEQKMLVRASSCLNKLYIGRYESQNEMENIFVFSIENTEGFHKA